MILINNSEIYKNIKYYFNIITVHILINKNDNFCLISAVKQDVFLLWTWFVRWNTQIISNLTIFFFPSEWVYFWSKIAGAWNLAPAIFLPQDKFVAWVCMCVKEGWKVGFSHSSAFPACYLSVYALISLQSSATVFMVVCAFTYSFCDFMLALGSPCRPLLCILIQMSHCIKLSLLPNKGVGIEYQSAFSSCCRLLYHICSHSSVLIGIHRMLN